MSPLVRRAAIAASVLALAGCKDYDSAVPLGPASEGVVEPRLLGSWSCAGTEDGAQPGLLVFSQFDETQYLIRLQGEGEEAFHWRAYSSMVGDLPFLNSQELDEDGRYGERGWTFLQYAFPKDGRLTLRAVSSSVFENQDDSIESARQALEGALGDPEALAEALTCTRPPD